MSDEHPARIAGRASQVAVRTKDKAAWLELFASDGWVEDPVGPSGFDPEGKGHHGRDAIGKFWDMSVAQTDSIDFLFDDSFACGSEAVFVGKIRTLMAGNQIDAEGVFKYRVDDEGKIVSLRAFWEVDRAMATVTKV